MAEACRAHLIGSRDLLAKCVESNAPCTKACTAALTEEIERIAVAQHAEVERERAIDCFRASFRQGKPVQKQGRLDLVATFPDGSTLAIEIDRAFKNWSARKLRHAKAAGMVELWIRWSGAYTWLSDIKVLNVNYAQRRWETLRT